eukprot:2937730-Rhodomonas_salina.3
MARACWTRECFTGPASEAPTGVSDRDRLLERLRGPPRCMKPTDYRLSLRVRVRARPRPSQPSTGRLATSPPSSRRSGQRMLTSQHPGTSLRRVPRAPTARRGPAQRILPLPGPADAIDKSWAAGAERLGRTEPVAVLLLCGGEVPTLTAESKIDSLACSAAGPTRATDGVTDGHSTVTSVT